MFYIGIDGNGKYGRLAAAGEDGAITGRHAGLGLLDDNGRLVRENLQKLIFEFLKLNKLQITDCGGVCIGADNTANDGSFAEALSEMGVGAPVRTACEMELFLAGECGAGPNGANAGLLVMSSASAAGYVTDGEGNGFSAGTGHLHIDDAGSGFRMGMEAIRHIVCVNGGRHSKSVLYDKAVQQLGFSGIDELDRLVNGDLFNPAKIAELSMAVKLAAKKGDGRAKRIERQVGKDLYELAASLLNKCPLASPTAVIGGSVLLINDGVREAFTDSFLTDHQDAKIIKLKEKSETGAAYMAMRLQR